MSKKVDEEDKVEMEQVDRRRRWKSSRLRKRRKKRRKYEGREGGA